MNAQNQPAIAPNDAKLPGPKPAAFPILATNPQVQSADNNENPYKLTRMNNGLPKE